MNYKNNIFPINDLVQIKEAYEVIYIHFQHTVQNNRNRLADYLTIAMGNYYSIRYLYHNRQATLTYIH